MELKDGKRHGEFLRFFPDGKPGLISEYMDGVQTGIYQAYFSNGKIKEKRFKKDSIFVAVSWLENGSLYSISEEKGDTVFHGRMAYFNTDKSVQSIFRYKNGAKDGTFAICHENGKMNYTGSYKNDLTDGVWLQFFESGKLKGIEVYDKGKRTGTWKYFHENGKLFSRIIFSNNRIYKKTEWDENGNKTDEFSRE
jgi:antitoxin component YwqK of YwqJK toxin-antitoxin module